MTSSRVLRTPEPVTIRLASVDDWAGFSRAVRALRAEGVAVEQVSWRVDGEPGDRPTTCSAAALSGALAN
jgi:hypothetical protein